jgi:hypothetical protein
MSSADRHFDSCTRHEKVISMQYCILIATFSGMPYFLEDTSDRTVDIREKKGRKNEKECFWCNYTLRTSM